MIGVGFGSCSGVLIKNTSTESIVLTAKHCIGTAEEIYVEGILATNVVISLYDDTAYLKFDQEIPGKMPVIISEFAPKKGDLAIVIGYPSFDIHVSVGAMQLKSKDWQYARINIIPGCSGSGVYNEYAELVGIAWGAIGSEKQHEDKTTTIGVFERYEDLIRFVKDHKLLE